MLSVLLRSRARPMIYRSALHVPVRRASSLSLIRRSWNSYARLLETRPLRTKIVTGGVIMGMGDVLCQFLVNHLDGHKRGFDAKRAAIFTVLGGGVISPMLHVWYKLLGALLPGVAPLTIAKRLALDQLVFAPTFLPVFLSLVMALEGHVEQIPAKLRADWWPVTKANWVVWVPAQFINFRFVPGSMQVLFSNVLGLLWNAYLSYVSHSGVPKKETIGDEEVTHVEDVQS